jgi:hypothetical protein
MGKQASPPQEPGCQAYIAHSWGVAQDEKAAFTWFGRACELTMLADEVQVENNDLLAKKNKSKLTVSPLSSSFARPLTLCVGFSLN